MTKKGSHTGDDDNGDRNSDNYNPQYFPTAAVLASSGLDPAILLGFEAQDTMATLVGYKKIIFSIFTQVYLPVLLVKSSISYSTGTSTN